MSDLRKLLASALAGSDLSEDPTGESPLDRVRALAFSDRLGSHLWRLKWAHDAGAYRPAAALLAKRLRRQHEPREMVERVAEAALREWLDELCPTCGGRGHAVIEGTPTAGRTCVPCNGTGLRRYRDADRMRATGLTREQYPRWEARFARAHSAISAADRRAWGDVAAQLERIAGVAGVRQEVMHLKEKCGTLSGSSSPAQNHNDMRDSRAGSAAGAQLQRHAG